MFLLNGIRVAFCSVLMLAIANAQEQYTLTTPAGTLTGTLHYVGLPGFPIKATKFLGIPFAEPPVGNLRFEKPVYKPSWTSTLNATRHGAACAQFFFGADYETPFEKSEDCLFLNVYVPYNMSATGVQSNKRAVMVWIYGGGFANGDSNSYDSTLLAGSSDVIVVTINYRLGYYGFLTSGDDVLPGNLGLWDQHTAIRWVHDNIESFGGDSSSITIFGESAGSASVVYQCFYPGNLGLFHRAIAMSGTITSPWAFMDKDVASMNVKTLATNAGCTQQTMAGMIECLKSVPSDALKFPLDQNNMPVPVLDNEFVLDTPDILLSGYSQATNAYQMFYSVDLMLGTTNADGLTDIFTIVQTVNATDFENFVLSKNDFENTVIPFYLTFIIGRVPSDAILCAVVNEYTDWSDPISDRKRALQMTEMTTEALFTAPTVATANLHTMDTSNQQRSTFLYEFAVKPITRLVPVPIIFDGDDVMNHADDLVFLFGMDIEKVLTDGNYTYLLNTYLATMTLWSNFAKSGNPNGPNDVSSLIISTWPAYTETNKDYILITKDMSQESIKSNLRPQAVNFWTNIFPSLIESTSQDTSRDDLTVRVTTPVGEIIGVERYVPFSADCGYRVQHFLGIPYAKSPTGDLRFQKPMAKEAFTMPFNATKFGPACIQDASASISGGQTIPKSEDCLLLNVYVPIVTASSQEMGNKAVMVWIHGGGFTAGQSNTFDPTVLSGYSDVIVVTINYRLGVYGFMTTGDSTIPSNIGLWDQHMALKWVHNNIAAFGGDINRVTLFGESAGGISVNYQAMYPGNRGLFQRIISQSGTIGNPRAHIELQDAIKATRDVSSLTNCPLTDTHEFLKCLQSKTITELNNSLSSSSTGFTVRPTRDNDFILDTPQNILSGNTNARAALDMYVSIDLISGFNSADGLLFSLGWTTLLGQTNPFQFTCTRDEYETILVPNILQGSQPNLAEHVRQSVIHEYTDWSDPDSFTKRVQQLTDLPTDIDFAAQAVRIADLHMASNRSTYVYKFSVRPLQRTIPIPPVFDGPTVANHGDDIDFVMGSGITRVSDSDDQQQQLRVYLAAMTMWSNFAKSGNPNTPVDVTRYIYTSWPQYTSSKKYLEITPEVTQHAVKERPRLRAVNFWANILPNTSRLSQTAGQCETSAADSITSSTVTIYTAWFLFIVINILLA